MLMLNVDRKLQECLHEHGGGEVGQIWFDGDVPLFLVNFHTKLSLRKLLAGQSELEKKLITKLQSRLQPLSGHVLKVCLKPSHDYSSDVSEHIFACLTCLRLNACYVVYGSE